MELSIPFVLVVGAVSSAIGVGVTWGLLTGRVSSLEVAVTKQATDCAATAARTAALTTDVAVVKAQHDRIREDLEAMERRITATITVQITSLRNEIAAASRRE